MHLKCIIFITNLYYKNTLSFNNEFYLRKLTFCDISGRLIIKLLFNTTVEGCFD